MISNAGQGDDPDKFLLPHLIGHYPLESVNWWVAHSWDPLSRRQTEALVDMLDSDLWRNLPWAIATDDKFKQLIEAIYKRLRNRVFKVTIFGHEVATHNSRNPIRLFY